MRWSYILPRFIFLALIWAFFFFAFDPILKWSLRKGLEKAAGARVEIGAVKTSFLHPAFYMGGVAVGSAKEEYSNLFEFSEIKLSLEGAPLLEKKFVIDEASLSGLKFGTPRKTSARLPLAKKEETPQFVQDLKEESKELAADRMNEIKAGAVKDLQLSADSLSSVKVYEELRRTYETQYAALKEKADLKPYQARMDGIKKKYEEARAEKNPLTQIKDFAALQKDVKKVGDDFQNDRKLIEETAAGLKEGLKAADEARKKDIEAVMGKMKMPVLDARSLAGMLAGPAVADKTQTAFKWLALARRYMPDNSQKQILKADAVRGRTVHFPKLNAAPSFLIKRMAVSGELGSDAPLEYAGSIEGLTTQPQIYGKPLTAAIKGSKGARALDFRALLDNTGTAMKGELSLKYSGMAVNSLTLGNPGSMGAAVTGGTGKFDGVLALEGENIKGNAAFRVEGAKVAPNADGIKFAPLKAAITNSLSGLSGVSLGIGITGTLKAPVLALTTDLADKLNSAFKNAFGAELDKAKAEAQAKVDAALKPYKAGLDALAAAKQQELKDKLDAAQKSLSGSGDGLLKNLKDQAAPGKLKLPKFKL
ncbi:MAG: TIGR03545 family protein [Elusimicrobiales bacterium]